MVNLAASFLIRSRSIAVKHTGTPVSICTEFDFLRIREFTAVICQKHRKQSGKQIRTEVEIKTFKEICNRPCIVVIAPEGQLQAGDRESDRKQYGFSPDALYRVELNRGNIRMIFQILFIVLQRGSALTVPGRLRFFFILTFLGMSMFLAVNRPASIYV